MDSTALSVISAVVTGLLGFLGMWYRDCRKDKIAERQRRWDIEDREAKSVKVLDKIAENTQVSVVAFDTANGHNDKIARLNGRMDGMEKLLIEIKSAVKGEN